jgi:hypothetical protein
MDVPPTAFRTVRFPPTREAGLVSDYAPNVNGAQQGSQHTFM